MNIFDGRKLYKDKRYHIESEDCLIASPLRGKTVSYILCAFVETLDSGMINRQKGYIEGILHERVKDLSIYKDLINVRYMDGDEIMYEAYVREDCVHKIKGHHSLKETVLA